MLGVKHKGYSNATVQIHKVKPESPNHVHEHVTKLLGGFKPQKMTWWFQIIPTGV
jgi:hypothetical protein